MWDKLLIGLKGLAITFLAGIATMPLNILLFFLASILEFAGLATSILLSFMSGLLALMNLAVYLLVWGYLSDKIWGWD